MEPEAAPLADSPEAPPAKPWFGRVLRLVIQLGITVLLLWLALRKVKWDDLTAVLSSLSIWSVGAALVALNAGMFVAAARQRSLLRAAGVDIPYRLSLWLYYRGMFYNMALPGGISGDGYKGYYLNRRTPGRLRRIITSLLLERLNGALGLAIWVALLLWVAELSAADPALHGYLLWLQYLAAAGLVLVAAALFIPLRLTALFARGFRAALPYSLGVQACQLLFAWALAFSLGGGDHWVSYLLAFTASSLAAVLPISLGGIGVREYVLGHANLFLVMDPTIGLAIALLYNGMYLFSAGVSAFVPRPKE